MQWLWGLLPQGQLKPVRERNSTTTLNPVYFRKWQLIFLFLTMPRKCETVDQGVILGSLVPSQKIISEKIGLQLFNYLVMCMVCTFKPKKGYKYNGIVVRVMHDLFSP